MRILYVHQYFATPSGSTGTRSYEFARRWVAQGHQVIMLTTTAQLTKTDLTAARGRLIRRFDVQGIVVHAVAVSYRQDMGYLRRCWAFMAFAILGTVAGFCVPRPDVVFATSTPLTVGIPVLIWKWLRRRPFVFEVRDPWPAFPIQMGILHNRLVIWLASRLERLIYRQASAIVALSPGMARGIESVLDSVKRPITVASNASDTDFFRPDIDGSAVRQRHGWTDKFVLLYFGTMGRAQGLEFVVDAAARLRDRSCVHFVLIGRGRERSALEAKVRQLGLHNVEILDAVPKADLPCYVAACDVALVVLAAIPILEDNSANKFFDSLAAGKPVLLNYSGWEREVIESHRAGLGCRQGDLKEYVEQVEYLESHRDELKAMGCNARRLAETEFDRDRISQRVLDAVLSVG